MHCSSAWLTLLSWNETGLPVLSLHAAGTLALAVAFWPTCVWMLCNRRSLLTQNACALACRQERMAARSKRQQTDSARGLRIHVCNAQGRLTSKQSLREKIK